MPDPRLWDAALEFPVVTLSLGGISCEFEPLTGWIRPMNYGGHEVLRAAYFSVRGEDWSTVLPDVSYQKASESLLTFTQVFEWAKHRLEVRGRMELVKQGEAGALTVTYEADVPEAFRTNRTGLCVLFPGINEATGFTSKSEAGGPSRPGEFPPEVKHTIPATDVAEVTWIALPGVQSQLTVEAEHHEIGPELFEFEDQRNWTDDSFKLFVRPSRLPKPYTVPPGRIEHQFTLTLSGPPPTQRSEVIDLSDWNRVFQASAGLAIPGLGALRAESPENATWEAESADGGEWIVRLRAEQEERADTRLKDVGRLPQDHWWRDRFPQEVPWFRNSSGWSGHRFAKERVVAMGTNAQVHAFDVRSMNETGDGIAAILRSRPRGVILAPVSLGKHGSVPGEVDPRAGTPWHAAWVLSLLFHAQSAQAIFLAEWERGDLIDMALGALPRRDQVTALARSKDVVILGFKGVGEAPDTLILSNPGGARPVQLPDFKPGRAKVLTDRGWADHTLPQATPRRITVPGRTVLWIEGTMA
jgi:hypothetical protein